MRSSVVDKPSYFFFFSVLANVAAMTSAAAVMLSCIASVTGVRQPAWDPVVVRRMGYGTVPRCQVGCWLGTEIVQ
jgi:hypothetical protein